MGRPTAWRWTHRTLWAPWSNSSRVNWESLFRSRSWCLWTVRRKLSATTQSLSAGTVYSPAPRCLCWSPSRHHSRCSSPTYRGRRAPMTSDLTRLWGTSRKGCRAERGSQWSSRGSSTRAESWQMGKHSLTIMLKPSAPSTWRPVWEEAEDSAGLNISKIDLLSPVEWKTNSIIFFFLYLSF